MIKDSALMRWLSLFLVATTMLAAYFFVDMTSPLQKLFEVNHNWSPSDYGFFSGSGYALNMFGFLLLSGIILDKLGIRFTGFTATIFMFSGGFIKLYALSDHFNNGGFGFDLINSFLVSMPASAKLASIGFAIFGIGVEMIGISVSKIIVKWFKGKELALAMGMEMAIARLGTSLALFLSPQLAGIENAGDTVSGSTFNAVAFGLALISIGLLSFIFYCMMDKKLDKQLGEVPSEENEEEFKISDIGKILSNPGFWLVSLLCVLFYSGVFPFLRYAVNMMENSLGTTAEIGGRIAALLPIGTILLTPLIGAIYDKKGKGATMLIIGAVLLTLAHLTFALVPLTMTIAIAAIMVLGVAFSLVPAALWSSVPKIVEDRYLGTAYGLIFWIQNIGLATIPVVIGKVLEAVNTVPGGDKPEVYDYTVPMLIFASLGIGAAILGVVLRSIDTKMGYGLEKANSKL